MVGEAGPLWHVHMLGYSQVRPFVLTAARPKQKKQNKKTIYIICF
jgi:hypothetical protein